jgi:hypothetical protein
VTLCVTGIGQSPLSYQWWFNTTNLLWATNACLVLTNVQAADAGDYSVVVSNAYNSVTSAPAHLVIATVWLDTPSREPDGKFGLTLHSPAGKPCELWASTNLNQWTLVATLTNETGTASFTDPVTNLSRRFYRARQLP